jgi:hypothetical protein
MWKHKIGQKLIDIVDYFDDHIAPYGEVVETESSRRSDYVVSFGSFSSTSMSNSHHVLPQTPLTCLLFPEQK